MSLLTIWKWLRVLWPLLAYGVGWGLIKISGLG